MMPRNFTETAPANSPYWKGPCTKEVKNETIKEACMRIKSDVREATWRRYKARELLTTLDKYALKKLPNFTVGDFKAAVSTRRDSVALMGILNYVLKRSSGDYPEPAAPIQRSRTTFSDSADEDAEAVKIESFQVDESEAQLLVMDSKGRFHSIRKTVREQLSILPEGKNYGFRFPALDEKGQPTTAAEKQAMQMAIRKMLETFNLPFTIRYIKQKNALLFLRNTQFLNGTHPKPKEK